MGVIWGKIGICTPRCDIINCMLGPAEYPNKRIRAQTKLIPKVWCPTKYKDLRPAYLQFHLGKLSEAVTISETRIQLKSIVGTSQFAYQTKAWLILLILSFYFCMTSLSNWTDLVWNLNKARLSISPTPLTACCRLFLRKWKSVNLKLTVYNIPSWRLSTQKKSIC